ncbi:AAA family ATPase [Moraxella canis]|uniref:ATPase dynein-related AAA domain-containing protein n=1 Tax=Moraxella canis TaxID=90239 RepID=A0A1S9ZIE3_9GAMM|nr:AAA family ATPase [Moraxella canis]OOR83170.1 hypothetical protein B0180_06225 [Moraxella canis]
MEITLNNPQHEFTWIPAFEKIFDWLAGFEDKQEDLVDILIEVGIDNGLQDQLIKGEKSKVEVMDPFTFLSLLMKYQSVQKRIDCVNRLIDIAGLDTPHIQDLNGVPTSQPQSVWLFPYAYDRDPNTICLLWTLFKQSRSSQVNPKTFNDALKIKSTGFTKLTQSLFYTNPSEYLPIDSQTQTWLNQHGIEVKRSNWDDYQTMISQVASISDKNFYEISYEAWLSNQPSNIISNPMISTKATSDKTDDMPEVFIPLNRILYGPPGTGKTYKTTELAVQCVEPDWYQTWKQSPIPESEKRQQIKSKYDDLVSKGRIAFTTFHQSFAYEDFVEGIRPSVNKDSDETSSLSYDVMPGVFKSLCTLAGTNAKEQTGSTQSVDIEDKNIWKMSLGNTLEHEGEDIYNDCLENNYVLLGWGDDIDFTGCDSRQKIIAKVEEAKGEPYNYLVTAVNTFKNIIKEGDLIIISDGNHKFRAIAEVTGDYKFLDKQVRTGFQQSRPVKWLRIYDNSLPKEMLFEKSLSQMTLYNLKDGTINRDKLKELLNAESNTDNMEKPHLLIIDEINRGNISRIFGELITLLEPDKRKGGRDAREVILPYSKEKFSVPSNLYVLGTMNTADKSLAQIDFALRRRFEFIETLPDPSLLSDIEIFGIQLSELLTIMNQRIEVLLDREHAIGHAYFWSLKNLGSDNALETELANIFQNRIIPLLQEYFFSDWERIGWVLNDPAKKPEHRFIQVGNLQPDVAELFHSSVTDQIMDRRYHINTEAFTMPEAYTGIICVDKQAD